MHWEELYRAEQETECLDGRIAEGWQLQMQLHHGCRCAGLHLTAYGCTPTTARYVCYPVLLSLAAVAVPDSIKIGDQQAAAGW